jgi:hypothetical protein
MFTVTFPVLTGKDGCLFQPEACDTGSGFYHCILGIRGEDILCLWTTVIGLEKPERPLLWNAESS